MARNPAQYKCPGCKRALRYAITIDSYKCAHCVVLWTAEHVENNPDQFEVIPMSTNTPLFTTKIPVYREGKASAFFGLPQEKSDEPLVGWRTWSLIAGGGELIGDFFLKAVTAPVVWEGPVMTTNMMPNGELAKVALNNRAKFRGERGDYGVYSYKTLELLAHFHNIYQVWGQVENYGHVVEHELGYRAQKAIIVQLYTTFEYTAGSLAKRYACPVEIVKDEHKPTRGS